MRRLFKAVVVTIGALGVAVFSLIAVYSRIDPPFTALMAWRIPAGHGIHHRPVPLDEISPALVHAVLTSEDNRFCRHRGIDWREVEIVIDAAEQIGRPPRGASTITMQTARNLFLWPRRSYVRKALEVPIALLIELVWTKRRIVEVYLNIVEWGPGIYGAEMAARHHFGRPPARLATREAALLAAALPAPLERTAGRPGPVTRRAAALIEQRMARTKGLFDCVG